MEPQVNSPNSDTRISRVTTDISTFLNELAQESERSAVVLSAARLDNALEKLLKSYLVHYPGGSDNLFDQDRPLSTFSAKIALAYRMGLIDSDFEHSIQMIRKLRNDFAHSIEHPSLSSSPNKERLGELVREVQKHWHYSDMKLKFQKRISESLLVDYCTSIAILLLTIELLSIHGEYNKPMMICSLERSKLFPK